MPHPNRVQPDGTFLATTARGTLMGNRGILHDATGTIGAARWRHRAWISCELRHKNWHRKVLSPGTWTELFFLDEAVALAAGHRPCALCRRVDYEAFRRAWAIGAGGVLPSAPAMDAALHAARAIPGGRHLRRHVARLGSLPDGAMVESDGRAALLWKGTLYPCCEDRYGPALPRHTADTEAVVFTSPPLIAVLQSGFVPRLHPSLPTSST